MGHCYGCSVNEVTGLSVNDFNSGNSLIPMFSHYLWKLFSLRSFKLTI